MRPTLARRLVAEAVGTFLLVGIGTGSIVGLSSRPGTPPGTLAALWFLAVLLPVVLFVERSGAHLNPAVTLSLVMGGRFPWVEGAPYCAAQLVGAFGGSELVLRVIGPALRLGATVPHGIPWSAVFLLEFAATSALLFAVFRLNDAGEGRHRWRLLLPPAVVGASTFLIGPLTGSSLNPARTIAPAVLSGTYDAIGVYLVATVAAGVVVGAVRRRIPGPTAPATVGTRRS